MKVALFFEPLENNRVKCNLCSHNCIIADGKLGVCNVRENKGGELFTLVYGETISQNIDPIEKKPLYHFYPGSKSYSIATPGCNFRCQWCQNWEIAHMPRERGLISGSHTSPKSIIDQVIANGCQSISYTYTEPTIFFEFAYDIARKANSLGILNVLVTNGFMTPEMLNMISPYLDAANVDIKAFKEKTYQKFIGARLQPVLDNLVLMKNLDIWVEITTLVIPGINDDLEELEQIAKFIYQELGPNTPWHISRFFPHYHLSNVPPTSISTLNLARDIGMDVGLKYVYLGNVVGESNTKCHHCGDVLIQRQGYWVPENRLQYGICPNCGTPIPGVWSKKNSLQS
jgi:pyruvate formate lyase activating enzyme